MYVWYEEYTFHISMGKRNDMFRYIHEGNSRQGERSMTNKGSMGVEKWLRLCKYYRRKNTRTHFCLLDLKHVLVERQSESLAWESWREKNYIFVIEMQLKTTLRSRFLVFFHFGSIISRSKTWMGNCSRRAAASFRHRSSHHVTWQQPMWNSNICRSITGSHRGTNQTEPNLSISNWTELSIRTMTIF